MPSRLVSSDSHVTMPDAAWPDYLDAELRDRAPRVERTDEGDFRVFEGQRTPIMTLDIPFLLYYADHLWEQHRFWTESRLREPPSSSFRRQVWATFLEDPAGLRERDHIGVDRIMWASDHPHSETTWPNSRTLTDAWFSTYDEGDKAKILGQNCAQLYDLD
ncbi:MAG: hypothetical protein AMXMBFR46_16960 [Acidimicrobiia bacterium]